MIDFPTIRLPSDYSFDLLPAHYASGSGESLSGQVIEQLGVPWVVSMSWQQFSPTDAVLMQSFLDGMDGVSGLTRLFDQRRPIPRGTITGTPLVDGANQTGRSLNLKSMVPGQTFLAGDYIGHANCVYRIRSDVVVGGGGLCTLDIRPAILINTANNAAITIIRPTTYFRLRSNFNPMGTSVPYLKGWSKGISLEFIEMLP